MKNSMLLNLGLFSFLSMTSASVLANGMGDKKGSESEIVTLIEKYQKALNESNTKDVMSLYSDDAFFMPQNFKSVIGKNNINKTYDNIFKSINLNVKFKIEEIKEFNRDWAYVRTSSSGTQVSLSDKKETNELNQEVFILHRNGDEWVFSRYIFSTQNPPSK